MKKQAQHLQPEDTVVNHCSTACIKVSGLTGKVSFSNNRHHHILLLWSQYLHGDIKQK